MDIRICWIHHSEKGPHFFDLRRNFFFFSHNEISVHICIKRKQPQISKPWGYKGSGRPMKNLKNIGFPGNTGPDPLKITKLPSQHSILCHHLHASKMAFCWRADEGRLIVVFGSSLSSSAKKKTTKKVVEVGPPLTKLLNLCLWPKNMYNHFHWKFNLILNLFCMLGNFS